MSRLEAKVKLKIKVGKAGTLLTPPLLKYLKLQGTEVVP